MTEASWRGVESMRFEEESEIVTLALPVDLVALRT